MLFVGGVVTSREIAWFRFWFVGSIVITVGVEVGSGKGGKGARSKGRGKATRDKIDEPMT